jgi:hypothetical protein
MNVQKRNRQNISYILISSILFVLHYKAFVPFYCDMDQSFSPVMCFNYLYLILLNCDVINFITV